MNKFLIAILLLLMSAILICFGLLRIYELLTPFERFCLLLGTNFSYIAGRFMRDVTNEKI